jgi:hypothetical protein
MFFLWNLTSIEMFQYRLPLGISKGTNPPELSLSTQVSKGFLLALLADEFQILQGI